MVRYCAPSMRANRVEPSMSVNRNVTSPLGRCIATDTRTSAFPCQARDHRAVPVELPCIGRSGPVPDRQGIHRGNEGRDERDVDRSVAVAERRVGAQPQPQPPPQQPPPPPPPGAGIADPPPRPVSAIVD